MAVSILQTDGSGTTVIVDFVYSWNGSSSMQALFNGAEFAAKEQVQNLISGSMDLVSKSFPV